MIMPSPGFRKRPKGSKSGKPYDGNLRESVLNLLSFISSSLNGLHNYSFNELY